LLLTHLSRVSLPF